MTPSTAAAAAPQPERYDPTTIRLHWLTAALVVALWIAGKTIDWFSTGAPRIDARSTHIALGLVLALVVVSRIVWRVRSGRRLPPAPGLAGAAASAMHGLLYLLLVGVVGLGITNAVIRGDVIYGWFKIPTPAPHDLPLRHWVGHLHAWGANVILIAAGLHALAGIAHQWLLKDGLLRRMVPGREN